MRDWRAAVKGRLAGLKLSPAREAEIIDEFSQHLDDCCDELLRDGHAEGEAVRLSLDELADNDLLRNGMRPLKQAWVADPIPPGRPGHRGFSHVGTDTWEDVRYSVRALRRTPGFSAVAIIVLALGIGLVTTLFSFVNATMLRPWQVPRPESMVVIHERPAPQAAFSRTTIAEYRYLKAHTQTMAHLVATILANGSVQFGGASEADQVEDVSAGFVSADYFDAFTSGMSAGRAFTADDEDYGAPKAVAIISEQLWRNRLGSDPNVIGRSIWIQKHLFTIVGVAAPGFADVERGTMRMDLWMPIPAKAITSASDNAELDLSQFTGRGDADVYLLSGRLNPGVSMAKAEAELTVLSRQYHDALRQPSGGMQVTDTRPKGTPRQLPALLLLFLALSLIQVLACANVGNLLLARALSRQREIAIRLSLGASRARVVRQLLTDAAVLSVAAGVVGITLAFALPEVMLRTVGASSPVGMRDNFYAPDARVFWFAFAMAGLTTVLCGLAPALRGTRMNVAAVTAERHGRTAQGARLRFALLATQVALTTLLLVGAGLLTRGIGHAMSVDPGFALNSVQTISIRLQGRWPIPRREAFFRGLHDALKTSGLPPVAFSDLPPLSGDNYVMFARRPDEAPIAARPILSRPVTRNYFEVLNIPIVKGRLPIDDDQAREIVVSEATARALWPNQNPLGKVLLDGLGSTPEQREVVGVARDVPVRSLAEIEPVIYSAAQFGTETLLIPTLAPAVEEQVRGLALALEPQATITSRPLVDYVRDSLSTAEIGSDMAWGIGVLGLALAMVGAFGVFAYAVEERRREIGVRMALGARAPQVIGLVLMATQRSVVIGLGAGLVLSLVAAPLLRRYLYGLSPFDPVSYAGIAVILITSSGLASWIPARRATQVNPAISLRCE